MHISYEVHSRTVPDVRVWFAGGFAFTGCAATSRLLALRLPRIHNFAIHPVLEVLASLLLAPFLLLLALFAAVAHHTFSDPSVSPGETAKPP